MGGKRLNMSDDERKVHRAKIVKASRLKFRMLDEQRFLEIAASKKWIWRQFMLSQLYYTRRFSTVLSK